MANLLNVVDLPVPIMVEHELLGTRWRLAVGQNQAELCLPTVTHNAKEDRFSYETPQLRGRRFLDRWLEQWSESGPWANEWASTSSWKVGEPTSVVSSLRSMVLRLPVASDSTTADRQRVTEEIAPQLNEWYARFSDWMEVLTEQDLDSQHPFQSVVSRRGILRHDYWAQPVGGRYGLLTPTAVGITVISSDDEHAATKAVWSRAIREANRQQPPSDPWLLIRDARNTLRRELFRRSVLDAATAAELVLSSAIAKRLHHTRPQELVAHVQDQARDLGRKSQLARKLGIVLPATIQQDLIELRNRTVHANFLPTRAQAAEACKLASQLVSDIAPL